MNWQKNWENPVKMYYQEEVKKYKVEIAELINDETMKTRIWGRVYSKTIVDSIRIPDNLLMGEDKAYNLLALCCNENIRITLVKEKLYYYYQRNDSIVHTTRHSNLIYATKYLIDNLEKVSCEQGKKVIIMQAMHDMLAYRYLEMYSEHKDEPARRFHRDRSRGPRYPPWQP